MTTRYATCTDSTRLAFDVTGPGLPSCSCTAEKELPYSKVQVRLLEGMTHEHEFENIEQVLPVILEFIRGETK